MPFGPVMGGNGVVLRPAVDDDIDGRRRLGRDPEIRRLVGATKPAVARMTGKQAHTWFSSLGAGDVVEWVVEHDGTFLGTARLHSFDDRRTRARYAVALFDPAQLGRGLGRTVTRLVVQYGFDQLGLETIDLLVLDFNERAQRCYRACGFREVARMPSDVFDGGRRADDILMIMQSGGMSSAPDGSPVALYLALPGDAEAALIHAAIPAGAAILELGCGVGRVSRPLVALGHPVTGVDNSEEMLAHAAAVEGVETVLAELASLDLSPRAWPVVVLASHMINDERGADFLAAARRHLADDGVLIIERHAPGWIDAVEPSESELHGVSVRITAIEHPEPGRLHATMNYKVDGREYLQPFVAYEVDDERLADMAQRAELRVTGFLDDRCTWATLRR